MNEDAPANTSKGWGNFLEGLDKSKKYWIIYLILILICALSGFSIENYYDVRLEYAVFLVLCVVGVFCITYFYSHYNDKELYKSAFIIILLFGIIFSFLTPVLFAPDEVEHFVRAEITSNGVLFPEYVEGSFDYEGIHETGYYWTIQSTLDLIERSKSIQSNTTFDQIDFKNSTIFNTEADTQPINYTPVKYHSAFAQNPFFGYIAPAIGIAIAKLLSLNAIWLVWLGRIFNVTLYAGLAALGVKKTPILKIPLLVIACIPLLIYHGATMGIDALINGFGILATGYFFYMYKAPKKSLDYKDITKFSIIVLLLGLCNITCCVFILLLFLVPADNLKERKYLNYRLLCIGVIIVILAAWSKFIVTPGVLESWRSVIIINDNVSAGNQLIYMFNHPAQTFITLVRMPFNFQTDLVFSNGFNSLFLMFLGAVCFFYPMPKFDRKTRIGVALIFLIFYIGTYVSFLLFWNPAGQLYPINGVEPRCFYPIIGLLPFILGINHVNTDKTEIDLYFAMILISFISISLISIVAAY